MSRSTPWRNKPTPLILQMIPVAAQMKLYLVNEIGPTSFLFKDQNQNKFKVIIGDRISCSCAVVNHDHCIHTLYVMLKKYKVAETNPIIWQASYLDSQLDGLIHLKYKEKKKMQTQKKGFKPRRKAKNEQLDEDFPPLQQDAACPICYEEMQGQCYTTCTTCKKSIHSKCLKVWVNHKQDHNNNVTCPMCRSVFVNPLIMVYKDLQRWETRFSTHKGTLCRTCGKKNIKGLIYKCLMCSNTDLCKMCYEGNQHIEHDRYFVKELSTEAWRIAPLRVKKSKKQLFEPILQVNPQQLSADIESEEFILGLFSSLKQHNISQNSNELNIIGNDMHKQLCYKCRNQGTQTMKRLNCGHSVHEQCLISMIKNKDYVCQVDQQSICPGYLQAMGIKVVKKKNARMADCSFMRAEEETKKIHQKLEQRNFSVGGKVERLNEKTKEGLTKYNAKSKDRNFRIMKKNVLEKKLQIESLGIGMGFNSPMMVTGIGNQNPQQHVSITQTQLNKNRVPIPRSHF